MFNYSVLMKLIMQTCFFLISALKRNQPLRVLIRLNSSTNNLRDENNQSISKENGIPTKIVGQPTSFSHPHLVSPGELVPGLPVSEFKSRRSEFMKRLVNSIPKENRGKGHTVNCIIFTLKPSIVDFFKLFYNNFPGCHSVCF